MKINLIKWQFNYKVMQEWAQLRITVLTFSSSAKQGCERVSRWDEMDLAKVHEKGYNLLVIQGNLYNFDRSS